APIFKEFVRGALKGTQPIPFRVPPGIQLVRVSADTGLPAGPGARDVILEAFKPGQVPEVSGPVLDGSLSASGEGGAARGGTGGLY
ncbi:MAG TPA: penicillin-binding protein, partial [Alphaproteobacteria bacterium]|nr:penicillin-binding protein [Alphaproteobacteria bacterium]